MILPTWLSLGRTSVWPLLRKRYFISAILAIGLHSLLFLGWAPNLQSMQFPLQEGNRAVSIQLINSAPSIIGSKMTPDSASVGAAEAKSRMNKNNRFIDQARKSKSEKLILPPLSEVQKMKRHSTSNNVQWLDQNIRPMEVESKQVAKSDPLTPLKDELLEKKSEQHVRDDIHKPKIKTIKPVESKVNDQEEQLTSNKSPRETSKTKAIPSNKSLPMTSQIAAVEPEGVLAKAHPQSSHNPKYPRRAIVRNQQGTVKIKLLVDNEGQAKNVELIESSGYTLLDNSVLSFVAQERFVPATRDGEPTVSSQLFIFRFVLE